MSSRRFPFGHEDAPPRSTLPMDPLPEKAPAPWATTVTAPLSAIPVSGVRERLTEPVSMVPRGPVLPFRAANPVPLDKVPARPVIAPLKPVEPKQEQEPMQEQEQEQELKPMQEPRKRRDWLLTFARASVVTMLFVTALQVVVAFRPKSPAASRSTLPLPTATMAVPRLSSAPLPDAPSAAPAPPNASPSAPPVASTAPVHPRAPVPRKRPLPRGDVIDPWAEGAP